MKSLETLSVTQTKVTFNGLKELSSVKTLRKLYVGGTSVSPAGVPELRKVLPGVEIIP
jgi:hypothetical protein